MRLYFSLKSAWGWFFYTYFMKSVLCRAKCCRAGDIWVVSFLHDIQEKRTANLGHRATSAAVFLPVQKKRQPVSWFLRKGCSSTQSRVPETQWTTSWLCYKNLKSEIKGRKSWIIDKINHLLHLKMTTDQRIDSAVVKSYVTIFKNLPRRGSLGQKPQSNVCHGSLDMKKFVQLWLPEWVWVSLRAYLHPLNLSQ